MTSLPEDIKIYFYKTIEGEISIDTFEKWIYENKNLEQILKSDDYLDLISLDYKKSGAKYDLFNLLKKNIDLGEYEKYKILGLLKGAERKDKKLPSYLVDFYYLYCDGYEFLYELGFVYGLSVIVPPSNYIADTWDELNENHKEKLLNSFYPELEFEIKKIIDWIQSGEIVLKGTLDEGRRYQWDDFRPDHNK